ncbi:hypothetical protein TBLA_0H03680 [Henningerozyma blattae CBS 6284]|uniref:TATA-binding protein-associated factor mot1 n=1 Tax=Henningerozyma blattae (strain ATCC 34711 / CBS 6284 / DSM 70876 / NBRC 10599 / NRRL Y-10934 / UCD 77-7) TaxID=1071380 RepID=I2H8E8_HENB6|nr:hypothetical protein TBLA_0H03680 [Tetrapisispora blattae CBS 6284]CCH62650.1 hypothetical protein TBLA_0H03680 [Tetrapisispora blattae CBS 6284]
MTSQVSRLDRQVVLLETGSTQVVRNMAADQLADLAKQHPEDILSLISRVYPFLLAKKWETRVTAARAFGGIMAHYPIWEADTDSIKTESIPTIKEEDFHNDLSHMYSLDQWDMSSLLKSGKTLLASGTEEYSVDEVPTKSLKTQSSSTPNSNSNSNSNSTATSSSAPPASKKSARMMAMQKRKQRMKSKTVSPTAPTTTITSTSNSSEFKNPKLSLKQKDTPSSTLQSAKIAKDKLILEKFIDQQNETCWPVQPIYDLLLNNLIDENWEIRHGSSLGLRDLLKKHSSSIGKLSNLNQEENNKRNLKYLEDLATRIITIFTLDRFGDYVYDTVVAPVRESAAQTLATLIHDLKDITLLTKIFNSLKILVLQNNQEFKSDTGIRKIWEATHGGLLGLRYFVSIKTDFILQNNYLNDIIDIVIYGLNQTDDDIKSVATSILIPITNEFINLNNEKIDVVLTTTWASLSQLDDDLSSSVGSVMDLLSNLCQHEKILDILKLKAVQFPSEWSFKSLVPKLYPFLRHSISSVRKSVLNLLLTFLNLKDDSTKSWINGKIFKLIFQNILFEQNDEILKLSFQLYQLLLNQYKSKHTEKSIDHIFSKHLQPMLHLLNTPIGENGKNYSMETQYILKPSINYKLHPEKKRSLSNPQVSISNPQDSTSNSNSVKDSSDIPIPESILNEHINIDVPMINGDIALLGPEIIYNTRILAAKAFGLTLSYFKFQILKPFFEKVLVRCLELPYATPRLLCAIIMSTFCKEIKSKNISIDKDNNNLIELVSNCFGPLMYEQLSSPSTSLPSFREIVPCLKALRTQCQTLLTTFVDVGMLPQHKLPTVAVIVQGEKDAGQQAFSIEMAEKICNEYYDKLFKSMNNSYKLLAKKPLEDAKNRVLFNVQLAKEAQSSRTSGIVANYSSAYLLFNGLPTKLNPIIRSLMDSIKEEKNQTLQQMSGDSIIYLLNLLIENKRINVLNKIIKNLCGFICVDTSEVPEFKQQIPSNNNPDSISNDDYILTLIKEKTSLAVQDDANLLRMTQEAQIKRKGALYTLMQIFGTYGTQVFDKIEFLKNHIFDPLDKLNSIAKDDQSEITDSLGQSMVDSLGMLRALYGSMDKKFHEEFIIPYFPIILKFLTSKFSVFRYSAARTFADFAKASPVQVMTFIIRNVLPLLNNAGSVIDRQGSVELIYHMSLSMETDILPYVIFLIVPLLGRMSDSNQDVRNLATTTFASIIKLVPLEEGIKDPEGLPEDLMQGRERERDFIQQMMDPSKAQEFKVPVAIKATLRKYQQDGVNWLAFLNKYHLHGILCDDMGLGKTLQTICIMASDQYLRKQEYEETKSIESRPLPSLIICPPSLTGHWESEFEQYAPFLKILVYAGGPSVRVPLRSQLNASDIIVTSYDVTRNDSDILSKLDYNYCVLDEGHIIKNSQSKLAKAVKQIRANHRLILTGTPIQNNVVELWSLFDYLMPGFLGTEKSFQERFAKPIAASRNSRTSSKEQEAGALALEALHKQVLPFMLRRLKEDVLQDLPPKIIQDYYCELSDLQKQLYQDFAKKQKNVVEKDIENPAEMDNKQHIFQALQYMRKLCNHPSLVLSPGHPQLAQVESYLKQTGLELHDIVNAPKLNALRTLLFECGIGEEDMEKKSTSSLQSQLLKTENVISQHRALIFCQLKDMLDMVENDLFKKYMPSVTYMRLDGSVDPRNRQEVVKKFNEDPSIDCLLLTTKVGGLGLNLTGADTVIFVEHDWNPMNDLQAMDRAHRLGQKKVVNVYRIITKATLEEKIMGLQKFKMNIASTIVNQQNSGLASMDTNQLLDLFDADNVPSQESEERQRMALYKWMILQMKLV